MKVIKTLFLLPALLMLTASALQAARIYVVYDPECMDRLEYNYFKDGNTGVYVAYHIKLSASERIVFEVGREDGIEQDRLPAGVVNCSNGLFDRQTVKRINSKSDEVIIVYPTLNRRYIMMPVRIAAIHQWNGQVITYNSPTYSLRFDTKDGAVGENISYNNPNVQVYFEGRMTNECSGSYIFRQYTNATGVANAYSEIVIAPEVGIIEARSGLTPEDANNNVVVLERVNNRKFSDHLLLSCGKAPATQQPIVSNITPSSPPSYEYTGAKGTAVLKTTTATTGGVATMHTVDKGETLYGISKKYGVSVKQIQGWNNMGQSTSIRRGNQLKVSEAGAASISTPPSYDAASSRINTLSAKGADVQTSTTSAYHVVKSGETVGQLAMKYGYTEKRFRQINDLGDNDWIKIGQRLKTSDCDCPQSGSGMLKTYESGSNLTPKGTTGSLNTSASAMGGVVKSPGTYYNQQQQALRNDEREIRPSAYSVYDAPLVMPAPTQQANQSGMQFYNDAPLPITNEPSTVPQTVRTTQYDFNERTTPLFYEKPVTTPDQQAAAASTNQPASYYSNETALPQNYETGVSKDYHIVQSGENLYRIAKQYGLTVEYLRRVNNMNSDSVFANQRIALH